MREMMREIRDVLAYAGETIVEAFHDICHPEDFEDVVVNMACVYLLIVFVPISCFVWVLESAILAIVRKVRTACGVVCKE